MHRYVQAAAAVNATRSPAALDDVNIVVVLSESFSDPTTLEGRTQICAVPGRTYSLHFHLNARPEFFASGRLMVTTRTPCTGAWAMRASF